MNGSPGSTRTYEPNVYVLVRADVRTILALLCLGQKEKERERAAKRAAARMRERERDKKVF